jgi:drug/metabolite transporter (DMT)-like permease
MRWWLVFAIVASTVLADVLQSLEMKRHGEVEDFHLGKLSRMLAGLASRRYLVLAVFLMAISFFAFMKLLTIADLSFAVPVTAASFVLETLAAKLVLKEVVDGRRWAGVGLVACGVALLAL